MRRIAAVLLAAAACASACGAGTPDAPAPAAPPAALEIDGLDAVLDADAVPALFTLVRGARTRLSGAPPALSPRLAAAWETAVAEARARGVAVDLGEPVAGGATAVLLADTALVVVRCDLAAGGRGATILLYGAGAGALGDRPWNAAGPGIALLPAWPADLGRVEGVAAGVTLPETVRRAAAASPGARVIAGPMDAKDLGGAEVRDPIEPPGLTGLLVLTDGAAYVDLDGGVARIDDPLVLEALRAWFEESLWPAAVPPAADLF